MMFWLGRRMDWLVEANVSEKPVLSAKRGVYLPVHTATQPPKKIIRVVTAVKILNVNKFHSLLF
jgi:hypothetical protein